MKKSYTYENRGRPAAARAIAEARKRRLKEMRNTMRQGKPRHFGGEHPEMEGEVASAEFAG